MEKHGLVNLNKKCLDAVKRIAKLRLVKLKIIRIVRYDVTFMGKDEDLELLLRESIKY